MNLHLDIETVPAVDPELIAIVADPLKDELTEAMERIKAPANYKDPEKIAAYISEAEINLLADYQARRDLAIAKMSFDGAFARVCCIGIGVDDADPDMFFGNVDTITSEIALLNAAFMRIETAIESQRTRPVVIGHNVRDFDMRILWQRAVVLGIRPPHLPFGAKPWDEGVRDTMTMWNPDPRQRISLDKLCRILGVPSPKDGMSGADVWPAYQAGKYEEIARYCRGDVASVRAVYKRLAFES